MYIFRGLTSMTCSCIRIRRILYYFFCPLHSGHCTKRSRVCLGKFPFFLFLLLCKSSLHLIDVTRDGIDEFCRSLTLSVTLLLSIYIKESQCQSAKFLPHVILMWNLGKLFFVNMLPVINNETFYRTSLENETEKPFHFNIFHSIRATY